MIVAIVGPTGVGKTKMSVELAKKYDAEIISCDSMQIYKGMDIATAKVTTCEMQGIKHHMIDIKNVNEDYSVYDYQKDARKILDELLKKNKNVVIVGGTGLYLKALLYDYRFNKNDNKKDSSSYSNEELYNLVKSIDKDTKIHKNNRQRMESYLNNHDKKENKYGNKLLYENVKIIGLTRPREELYNAINKRVDKMLDDGLIKEAKAFYDKKINSKAINTAIGYKELYMYFDDKTTKDEALDLIKKRSRNYAKRQYTWFNNQMNVKWFLVDVNNFTKTIDEVINYIENN